ncbi:MAG TPA: glycosyltransferase [Terracidiphilus sp.]|nr:glycosyltransferase [Terracidiphilus sp.]
MCHAQRAAGHDPSVYAITSLGPLGEQLICEGYAVCSMAPRHLPGGLNAFYRAFRECRPDVVHLHNPTPTVYAAFPARAAGVRSIVSTRHGLVGAPLRRSVELRYAVAARFCNCIVGVCDATVDNLNRLHTIPKHKLLRIYNGTLPIERIPLPKCPPKSGFTLLFVGRLAPVKNLQLLLNAFQTASAVRPELRLWIVGDGSERRALESLATDLRISNAVTFWGEQLDPAQFYSAADLFTMSSTSEGLPVSLIQGFSLGVPAVVTDVGGMAEAVKMGNAGIVVPAGQPRQMAEAILRLIEDRDLLGRFSQAASELFASRFTLAPMVSAYHQLYSAAL